MASDPNLQWNGQQWIRWDGSQWQPATGAGVAEYSPARAPYATPVQYPQPAYPQVAYAPAGPAYVTDQGSKNVQATIAWVLTVLTVGYLLPWAIAASRGKSNAGMIGILNVLLGWTVIGWIIALVMACGTHQVAAFGAPITVVNAVGMHPQYPAQQPVVPHGSVYAAPATQVPVTNAWAAPGLPTVPPTAELPAELPGAPAG
jgi:hypothetical protein